MRIVIQGIPIAKKRPRFVRRGKYVTVFNPQETEEGRWLWEAKQHIGDAEPMAGGLAVRMVFYMPIPKSAAKKTLTQIVAGELQHTKKPDLDNLVKFAKDCLNGVAWGDDSQVCHLLAAKIYSTAPHTEIEIDSASTFVAVSP